MVIENVILYDNNAFLFASQLKDIASAKKSVYIELYRFQQDSVGEKFLRTLTYKAKKGVLVKLIVDAWGTQVHPNFFDPLIHAGGEVRFFQKLSIFVGSKNHQRNHRKLFIIDEKISYIGSSNISGYSLPWRELNLRITGSITLSFKNAFFDSFEMCKGYNLKTHLKKPVYVGKLILIQESPSIYRQQLKKEYETLIASSTKEIVIETPYFLPGFKLRKSLMDAAKRGVDVKIISPYHSDVRVVDIVRKRYYGMLHKSGVQLVFYMPENLHAKCLYIDNEIFSISSANFDYRSFRYQYEIALIGKERNISTLLDRHIANTLSQCTPFNYEKWLRRSCFEKLAEWILLPFRYIM